MPQSNQLTQSAKIVPARLDQVPLLLDCLEQGGMALLPMATTYTLVVHGERPHAIAALRQLKRFSQPTPLGILTRQEQASRVAVLNSAAQQMLSHFPYPVTLLVKAHPHLDPGITQGLSHLFLACPDPFIYDLLAVIPFPLVAATAKVDTELIVSFAAAKQYFSDQVDLIMDGGRSHYGRRGTLIDFTLEYPTIMNFGPVSVDDLRPLLPDVILPSHLMK